MESLNGSGDGSRGPHWGFLAAWATILSFVIIGCSVAAGLGPPPVTLAFCSLFVVASGLAALYVVYRLVRVIVEPPLLLNLCVLLLTIAALEVPTTIVVTTSLPSRHGPPSTPEGGAPIVEEPEVGKPEVTKPPSADGWTPTIECAGSAFPRCHVVQPDESVVAIATRALQEYAPSDPYPDCVRERLLDYIEAVVRNNGVDPETNRIDPNNILILHKPSCGGVGAPAVSLRTQQLFDDLASALLQVLRQPFRPNVRDAFYSLAADSAIESILRDIVQPAALDLADPWLIRSTQVTYLAPRDPSEPSVLWAVLTIESNVQVSGACYARRQTFVLQALAQVDPQPFVEQLAVHRNWPDITQRPASDCQRDLPSGATITTPVPAGVP